MYPLSPVYCTWYMHIKQSMQHVIKLILINTLFIHVGAVQVLVGHSEEVRTAR